MSLRTAWTFEGLETAFSGSAFPLPIANVGVRGEGPGVASDESNLLVLVNPYNTWKKENSKTKPINHSFQFKQR